MKFKRIAALTMAAGMLFSASAGAKSIEFTVGDKAFYVSDNGMEKKEIEAVPYIENGRTMVPVRVISEQFGAYVSWDGRKGEVSITADGKNIKLTIGADKAYVDENLVSLDAPAVIKEGRTMVPLRFISEALGRDVGYVDVTRQIVITDETPVIEINGEKIYADDIKFMKEFAIPNTGMADDVYTKLLMDYIREITVMKQIAEKDGKTLSADDNSGIDNACKQNGELIYKTVPVSSAAKMLKINTIASNYIQSYSFDITEEEINEVYKNNYICAKHILLLTIDPNTGESYSTKAKNEASEKAAYALRKLKSGVSFDDVMKEFGEDPGVEFNTEGYVFTKGDMIEKFENAAFALRTGEMTGVVESELGYHIIKRVELPKASSEVAAVIYNSLAQTKYEAMLKENIEKSDIKQNFTTAEIAEMIK